MSEEIRNALAVLFPAGGIVELRAITDTAVHSGYFDNFEALAAQAVALVSLPEVQGIYVTLNEVNPALLARRANRVKMRLGRKDATTSDADILHRYWLPVDLDPVRPSGVSSTDAEHAAALERAEKISGWLAERGFPDPVIADSGNGAHLLYRINLPNDKESGELVKQCLATLDALFSDEAVTVDAANFNPARIWKLYGTVSRKGDHTPVRPHRMARILSVPSEVRVADSDLLEDLARSLSGESQSSPEPRRTGPFDLRSWLGSHSLCIRSERPWNGGTLFNLDECPFTSDHRDGAFAIQFANGAVFAGCHHQSCGRGSQRWQELRRRFEGKRDRRPASSPVEPPRETNGQDDTAAVSDAMDILRSGDPLRTMLQAFALDHEGDETVAECLILSLASRSVVNTNGLHVSVTGESGKGKSHAFTTLLRQVPERFRLKGAMSNKALFYLDNLQPGTVIVLDDTTLSDEMQEVLKGVTTSFREPFIYRTVSRDRKGFVCTIPERCVWWVAKVEGSGDDQVFNRMLTCWIDDSPEQDRRVLARVLLRDQEIPSQGDSERPEVLACQAMWEVLGQRLWYVIVPFASRIRFQVHDNRRNPEMLLDLIKANTFLRCMQREHREENGLSCLVAVEDDFAEAGRLYGLLHGAAGGQLTKLTKREADLLAVIESGAWSEFTIPMLQKSTGWSNGNIHKIIHGYRARETTYTGLLEKCPSIAFTDRTIVTEEESGLSMRRRTNAYTFDREIHRHWMSGGGVWIDPGEDDDDDSCNTSPSFPVLAENVEGLEPDRAPANLESDSLSTHVCGEGSNSSQASGHSESHACEGTSASLCVCDSTGKEVSVENRGNIPSQEDPGANNAGQSLPPDTKRAEGQQIPQANQGSSVRVSAYDYKMLDIPERTPCYVCGKKESWYVEKLTPERRKRPREDQNARRICKKCYAKAVERARASASVLPGVIDYLKMKPVTNDIGRCSVCGLGKAVWIDSERGVKLCEECFNRE